MINKVFLHHLVSKISQNYKKNRVWALIPLIKNPTFCYSCENRHQNLKFFPAKSFCDAYFKLYRFVVQHFGFTVLNFCDDESKNVVDI